MSYSNKQTRPKKRTALKFWLGFGLLLVCAVLTTVLYFRRDTQSNIAITPGEQRSVNVVAGEQLFSTPYFEFTAGTDWQVREDETVDNEVYAYSQFSDNGSVLRHLKIYVNNQNKRFQTPFILPVSKINGSKLQPESKVSSHCRQQPGSEVIVGERMTVLAGVEFLCDVDATDSRVAVGLVNGGFKIPHTNSAGETNDFIIEYNDVTFKKNDSIFDRIVKSFEFR